MRLGIIVACDQASGIGLKGKLPWEHFTEDLLRFKRITMGRPVIMGRHTYESIKAASKDGRILPNREVFVVTSKPGIDNMKTFSSLPELLADLDRRYPMQDCDDVAYVIGGERLYREALPLAEVLHITRIYKYYGCDKTFPAELMPKLVDEYSWQLDAESGWSKELGAKFIFEHWRRGRKFDKEI